MRRRDDNGKEALKLIASMPLPSTTTSKII